MNWRKHCKLHQGDYSETLALCDGQADLVLTSPPYCDARTYGADVNWTMEDYYRLGRHVFKALKPGGHALINVDAPVREWRKGFGTERGFHPWRLMLHWAEVVGFRVPDRLAFGRMGLPGEYRGRFRNDWEPLLWFQRPGAKGWEPDTKAIAKPPSATTSWGGRASCRTVTGEIVIQAIKQEQTTRPGNLWDYGAVGGVAQFGCKAIAAQNHPARWPYKLAEDIVRCFCPPGGLAVDPFCGAGTSLAAALEHGRRAIGGDLLCRQDNEDNRRRGLDPVPWVDVTARVLDGRFKQVRLFDSLTSTPS